MGNIGKKIKRFTGTLMKGAGSAIGGAASSLPGMVLGMATSKWQDRRQREQQQALQDMQLKGQKDMGRFNQGLALEMWDKTNYDAQVKQMKKAGINPGLMYGGTGAGGTTQGGAAGSVSGASASGSAGEAVQGMGLGLQGAMMKSQIDLAKSQADKNAAEADAIRGYKKDEGVAHAGSLVQGIENAKAQEKLTNVQTGIASLQKEILEGTKESDIKRAFYEMDKIAHEATSAMLAAGVDDATYDNKIKMVGLELANMVVDIAVKKSGIAKNDAQIAEISEKLLQGWESLFIQSGQLSATERSNKIRTFEAEVKAAYPGIWNAMGNQLENIWDLGEKLFGEKASYRHSVDK